MNERIRELALQAMTYVTHNPKANKLNSGDMFDEKFAELIVRMCADAADMYEGKSDCVGDCVAEYMGYRSKSTRLNSSHGTTSRMPSSA